MNCPICDYPMASENDLADLAAYTMDSDMLTRMRDAVDKQIDALETDETTPDQRETIAALVKQRYTISHAIQHRATT